MTFKLHKQKFPSENWEWLQQKIGSRRPTEFPVIPETDLHGTDTETPEIATMNPNRNSKWVHYQNARSGDTALECAIQHGRVSIVKLFLSQAGRDSNLPNLSLLESALTHPEMMKLLLHQPGFHRLINFTDKYGLTLLHHAVIQGHIATTEVLIRNGSDLEAMAMNRRTPLGIAFFTYKPKMIQILKAVGANSNIYFSSRLDYDPRYVDLLRQPLQEETILEIRHRIYFQFSLVSILVETMD